MTTNMVNDDYCTVFKHLGSYVIAVGRAPDTHLDRFEMKLEALIAARAHQVLRNQDPNFVVDLTNVSDAELVEFLR